jgi:uncharacterized repeat protein (TIGR03806 family)
MGIESQGKDSMRTFIFFLSVVLVACGDAGDTSNTTGWTTLPQEPYRTLTEWKLFADVTRQTPSQRVMPYEVNSPLFSDFTAKFRYIALPPGRTITYRDEGIWDFPEGTVLVKTFAYPRDARTLSLGYRLLETRLLVRTRQGWVPHTYVYNDAGTEAIRQAAAPPIQVSWIDETGATRRNEYMVPNSNQCLTCHGQQGNTNGLGVRTEQLHRGEQINTMAAMGWFATVPSSTRRAFARPDDETATVEARARAYLHANCGHCHNPRDRSTAMNTGLNLEFAETSMSNLGACRRPAMAGSGSGGLDYDVVPGHPERSVMLFRMRTSDPRARMPSLGLNFNHEEGALLIERWIREMPSDLCTMSQ